MNVWEHIGSAHLFEAAMLTAFSVSWYCSIWKMLVTGEAGGKSLGFVILVVLGYCLGIVAKGIAAVETGEMSLILWLYLWNLLVTGFDGWLVWHLGHPARSGPRPA